MAEALCPECTLELGDDVWCDGHREEGEAVLRRLPALPPEWADVTRLWWVATGEVRLDRLVFPSPSRLAPPVRAALPSDGEAELPEPGA